MVCRQINQPAIEVVRIGSIIVEYVIQQLKVEYSIPTISERIAQRADKILDHGRCSLLQCLLTNLFVAYRRCNHARATDVFDRVAWTAGSTCKALMRRAVNSCHRRWRSRAGQLCAVELRKVLWGSVRTVARYRFKRWHPLPYPLTKRILDVVFAIVLLVLLSPVLLVVALTVRIGLGAPVLFCQWRPGRDGVPFKLRKFRTMAVVRRYGPTFASEQQCVSGVGSFLRRSRLDELPQLFNILVGQMSFVGPRPLLPVDQPEPAHDRLRVRPGLTGWAQINGGREIPVARKAALDSWYVEHASLWLDARIVARTVPVVLRGDLVAPELCRELVGDKDDPIAVNTPQSDSVMRHLGA